MNWLGWDTRSYVAALVGAALGFWSYGAVLARGVEAPWIVGLLAGLCCAAISLERSIMRGLVVGCVVVWTTAAAQVTYMSAGTDIVLGLTSFHESLTWPRFGGYVLCAALAIAISSTSIRRGARKRVAGS